MRVRLLVLARIMGSSLCWALRSVGRLLPPHLCS